MKVSIRQACGHVESKTIRGDEQSRASMIAWLEKSLCRRCFAEDQRQKQLEAEKEALQMSIRLGFPIPTGSESETKQAIMIRQRLYETACRTVRAEEHRQIRRILAKERTARFWIDRKRDPPRMVLNTILARHPELTEENR